MSESSPYTPPAANTDRLNKKVSYLPYILLAVIAVYAFIAGVGNGVLRDSQYYKDYHLATVLIYLVLAAAWYQSDTDRLGYPRSAVLAVTIVFITIIGIPVYLFRSRGAAKGAIATVLFILFVLGCGVLNAVGDMIVVGVDHVR